MGAIAVKYHMGLGRVTVHPVVSKGFLEEHPSCVWKPRKRAEMTGTKALRG